MDWTKTVAKAKKILGDDVDIPDTLPSTITSTSDAFNKATAAFKAAREECEKKLLELENVNSSLLNATEQLRARYEKNSFGLDAKKDAKKIALGRKVLTDALDEATRDIKGNQQKLGELDKHLIQLGGYKQSTSPMGK